MYSNKLYFLLFVLLSFSTFSQKVKVLEHDVEVKIQELKSFNTKFRECNLSLMPNGDELYFMSDRSRSGKNRVGDGDIYRVVKTGNDWGIPEFINQINTFNGEDEPSISYDGEKIYFQSWKSGWEGTGGPYYEATIENGILKNIRGLGGGINQFFRREYRMNYGYATDGMAISPDGNLFIVACGSDYKGNMNLYYSKKKLGVWSFPQLLMVSTLGDERSVYIAADNQTVYFSSDGYDGYGGLDIFKTSFDGIKTGPVTNIGQPFNSSKDDMGFVISGKGEAAFFIRDLDIFYADLNEIKNEIKPLSSSLIFGKVLFNNIPIQRKILVQSNNGIMVSSISDENGRYSISIPKSFSTAKVYIEGDTLIFNNQEIVSEGKRYQEFEVDFIAEKKIEKIELTSDQFDDSNSTYPKELKNQHLENELVIYFDFDNASINDVEFHKLKELLNRNLTSSIVFIEGHTDHIGTNEYNNELSRKRAEAVKKWFMEYTGIKNTQIDLRFKGETKTLNGGQTDKERAKNRRVTIKILSI